MFSEVLSEVVSEVLVDSVVFVVFADSEVAVEVSEVAGSA